MRLDRPSSATWLLLAASTIPALTLLVPSLDIGTARHVPDDALFYNVVARNILAGLGSTSDGLGVTNGYHPLWMACVLVFEALPGRGLAWELLALLGLNTLSVLLLRAWLQPRVGAPVALAVALLATAVPSTFRLMWSGMESSLALAALLGLLLAIDAARAGRDRWAVPLLLAVLVAARLDGVLAMPGLAWIGWHLQRGTAAPAEPTLSRVGRLLRWHGPTLVLLALYAAWNQRTFGVPIPISGLIKRLPPTAPLTLDVGYWHHAWQRFGLLVDATALRGATTSLAVKLGLGAHLGALHAARICGLVMAWLVCLRALRRQRPDDASLQALLLVLTPHLAYYTLLQRDSWSTQWARGPELVLFAVLIGTALAWLARSRPALARLAARTALPAVLVGFAAWRMTQPAVIKDFRVAWADFQAGVETLQRHAATDEPVLSRNIGLLGYHAHRRVVSRDGLLNSVAYREQALHRGQLRPYLRERGVRWLVEAIPPRGDAVGHLLRAVPGLQRPEVEVIAVIGPDAATAAATNRYAVARLRWSAEGAP